MRFPVPPFAMQDADPCFCRSGRAFAACCGSRQKQRNLPAGVQVFHGFLDPIVCQKWIKRLEKHPREKALTTDITASRIGKLSVKENPARIVDRVKPGPMRARVFDAMERGFQWAIQGSGHSLLWFEYPSILRYEPGGFYRKHADSCVYEQSDQTWYKIQDRDLSLLLYLNDDFEGGGLTFANFNYHFKPKPGDLLVFPSDNRYEHQAEKVTSGLRYCIASWAALKGTRKVFDKPPASALPFSQKSA